MSKTQIYQQGDVILLKRDSIPEGATKVKPKAGQYVIAEGEATGHAHVVPAVGVEVLTMNDTLWMDVAKQTELTHEEHAVQVVLPGVYELWQVREVDPFSEEAHKVMD